MALNGEQRAILELIHDRGLGYEEIDDLLGAEPGEARRRERAALAALTEEEAAELSWLPAGAVGSRRRNRIRLGAGVVAAVAIGLGAGVIFIGGSEESGEPAPAAEAGAADQAPDPVRVPLEATAAGDGARGEAAVGLDDRFQPYLDLDLTGLPEIPEGSIYVPWVELGGGRGVPVPVPIAAEGGAFKQRLELAPQLISVIDVGRELQVLPVDSNELQRLSRDVRAGGKGPGQALKSPGGAVLSGPIPKQ